MDERAKKYARQYRHPKLYEEAKQFYMTIAEEQKSVDDDHLREVTKMVIDKAWQYICDNDNLRYEDLKLALEE